MINAIYYIHSYKCPLVVKSIIIRKKEKKILKMDEYCGINPTLQKLNELNRNLCDILSKKGINQVSLEQSSDQR